MCWGGGQQQQLVSRGEGLRGGGQQQLASRTVCVCVFGGRGAAAAAGEQDRGVGTWHQQLLSREGGG